MKFGQKLGQCPFLKTPVSNVCQPAAEISGMLCHGCLFTVPKTLEIWWFSSTEESENSQPYQGHQIATIYGKN